MPKRSPPLIPHIPAICCSIEVEGAAAEGVVTETTIEVVVIVVLICLVLVEVTSSKSVKTVVAVEVTGITTVLSEVMTTPLTSVEKIVEVSSMVWT